jgi:hypothetical protein
MMQRFDTQVPYFIFLSTTVTILFALLLLANWWIIGSSQSSQATLEKEVYPVVDRYLDNAVARNWPEVYGALTGEALTGAKARAEQVKTNGEKIISREYKVSGTGTGLARVYADFTRSTAEGFDRLAYTFDIIKTGDSWLIYKTTWGEYLHDDLVHGQLPADAASTIRRYLEMPYSDKKAMDNVYLAGRLLQESEKSKALPMDANSYDILQRTVTTVKNMECLGVSGDFVVVKATCSVKRDSAEKEASFLIDMVFVQGSWKIASLETV